MQVPSSTKTEQRAVNVLENLIDEHQTMTHQFNSNDKEMSWDGYIWLFKKNDGMQSKANFDSRVPVQIKGHQDPQCKFLDKNKISYSVELDDLKAYATEKGVLYFHIFLNGYQREVFYASLYPSKIADYLEKAKKKGNSSSYSIPFLKLEKDSEKLYVIAKQFDNEAKKQGSAYTPLVKNRIRSDEMDKIKIITLTAVGAKDSYDVLSRLSSGDICLYGSMEGDQYTRPIEWNDESIFSIEKEVNKIISVEGEMFYHKYKCIADSNDGRFLEVSPNLEIRLTESQCKFKMQTSLKEVSNDARFLLKCKSANSFDVGGQSFPYVDYKMSYEFEKKLRFIVDLFDTLTMIDFDVDIKLTDCTEAQMIQLVNLVNLRLGVYNSQLQYGLSKYIWKFGDKCVPLLILKKDNKIVLVNSVYTNEFAFFLSGDKRGKQEEYRFPMFLYNDVDVLANLYEYNYDSFRSQIDNTEINEFTSGAFLEGVLVLINVFDLNSDLNFLALAEYLLQLLEPFVTKELILLNRLQIKKRTGEFNDGDFTLLNKIKSDEIHILFGKYVLLGNKATAKIYFEQFSDEDQSIYKGYPIYKLYDECFSYFKNGPKKC